MLSLAQRKIGGALNILSLPFKSRFSTDSEDREQDPGWNAEGAPSGIGVVGSASIRLCVRRRIGVGDSLYNLGVVAKH